MKVVIDLRVARFLDKLTAKDAQRAFRYIQLFEEYGFKLDQRYLKKVIRTVWELRPGKVRLYLFVKTNQQVVIHAIIKKSPKIRQEDIRLIIQRAKEYI